MDRLKKRAEFLAVARGVRSPRHAFVLQAALAPDPAAAPRCGFTVTKKVGNAVVRNRIRRRLREAVRLQSDALGRAGCDHVLIGRREALSQPFATLAADLVSAFRQAHKRLPAPPSTVGASLRVDGPDPAAPRHPRGETPGRTR
ncbi:ribonuclease P protein component [Siculibacillus lacustris]|uniref:Ribonuclease P protein component n=1 Tax=Siculibacillus lacustris TaxID=1549641 RepID=A0A4V2KTY8_9HYPH|nr:ribonuclease P protein component [Siculibacillus lacustris]TBW39265.1 ribonuclease P protein component [Siculibacillus lacustris]